jgi:Tc5 transposase-like DNA-binding protein
LTAMDDELQDEACKVVGKMEEVSTHPSDVVANWLVRLINMSTSWLAPFRQRAHLPRSEDMADFKRRSKDPRTIDSTVHNYSRLERELGEYLDLQHALGIEPDDADLQRQARLIIYELEDGWNQTAADNADWLAAFRQRHSQSSSSDGAPTMSSGSNPLASSVGSMPSSTCNSRRPKDCVFRGPRFCLNDANCYRRLALELKRYVASAMSPNNPNQHIPSDEELQHQARWILYDE